MAKITTITNPLTGQPAQVDQLDHTAQQIDDAVSRALPGGAIDSVLSSKPNPNLLDNPYFGNPVNQRGKTEYTSGYTIDRWVIAGGGAAVIVNNGYITSKGYFTQHIEKSDTLTGTFTASVLLNTEYSDGGSLYVYGNNKFLAKKDFDSANGLLVLTFQIDEAQQVNISFNLQSNNYIQILAVKLELGSQQTLAHQENGVWVLNEIPDYADTLARCKRYFQRTGQGFSGANTSNTRLYISGRFDVEMRTEPTVTLTSNTPLFYDYGNDINLTNAVLTSYRTLKSGAAYIGIDHSSISTSGRPIVMGNNYLDFSAEL